MTEKKLQLEDWLDDLCVRFLMNGPKEDLETPERICFRVEEAQWYYEDFIRPLDPTLPSMSLRRFCEQMFAHCPLLSPFSQGAHMQAFEAFLTYKARIPVRGAIMLNDTMDQVVLVKGWKKGAAWSFPRGKINKDEDDLDCAVREVYEETGFDIEAAGLVPYDRNVKFIELSILEQQIRLFVFRNVPMDTHFEPRTRKEISKIMWWRISDLPAFKRKGQQQQTAPVIKANNFYMVAPFLGPLRKWVLDQKKIDSHRIVSNPYLSAGMSHDEVLTEEDQGADSNAEGFPYTEASNATPNIESLAGATAALDRLLNASRKQEERVDMKFVSGPAAPTKDSGSALLALLQSRPGPSSQHTYQNLPVHTPFDHIIEEAPMPPTPHHEGPQHPQFPTMGPPPDFSLQQRDDEFSYDLPFLHNTSREDMESKVQQAQSHIKMRQMAQQQASPHHYQPQHLIHPQPLPPHVQRAVFTGGPVHSPMVPQPLPKQPAQYYNPMAGMAPPVPKFPGLHAPMVPQMMPQTAPKLNSHSLALLNAFKSRDQATVDVTGSHVEVPHSQRAEHEQSSVHLQGSQVNPNLQRVQQQAQGQPLPVRQHQLHQSHIPPSQIPQTQVQHGPGSYSKTRAPQPQAYPYQAQQRQIPQQQTYSPNRQPQMQLHPDRVEHQSPSQQTPQPNTPAEVSEAPEALHPHISPQNLNGNNDHSPSLLGGPRQAPKEQQRSALLGLFKNSAANNSAEKPVAATALPTTPTPSAVELSAVEPLSSTAATTSALLNDKRTPTHVEQPKGNKSIPEINPEATLPFRAMTILSRPVELSNQVPVPREIVPHRNVAKANGKNIISGASTRTQPNVPAFQPQILKRPLHSSPKAPEDSAATQEFIPLPKPVPAVHSSQSGEHKKTLLSLFGKAAPEPSRMLPRGATSVNYSAAPTFDPATRSRVDSIASEEAASRRGSQGPISPADKGFLLSYLDAVAKGTQQR